MRVALALALMLCLWFARNPKVSVVTSSVTRPLMTTLGPPLTADDIARGVQALSQQGRLSHDQHTNLNQILAEARPLRQRVSELQAARVDGRIESIELGARVLESK